MFINDNGYLVSSYRYERTRNASDEHPRILVPRCPLWDRFRPQMKHLADSHNRWGDTSFLLEYWSGVIKDAEPSKWKPNLAMVSATIKFAEDTGRLNVKKDEDQRQKESGSDNGDESEEGEEE
ncbi:hypothetical protein MMC31_007618 [Peltigera leucophlebia]|nr:hypothetical protein [Peltigera leucophlebia]